MGVQVVAMGVLFLAMVFSCCNGSSSSCNGIFVVAMGVLVLAMVFLLLQWEF